MSTHRAPACGFRGFTLIEVLVTIFVILILIVILLPALQAVRAAARRTQCANNLRQLGLAIGSYTSAYGVMPIGHQGKGFSLHVQLLPYLEQIPLYNLINFQTHSALFENKTCASFQVATFLCPADVGDSGGTGVTNYAGNRGYGFDENGPFDNGGILFSRVPSWALSGASDGNSNTVAMSEWLVTRGAFNSRTLNRTVLITDQHISGPSAYGDFVADCNGMNLNTSRPSNSKGVLWMASMVGESLYTHDYGVNGRSCSNGGYVQQSAESAGSLHNGMAQALFLDGHVTPVRDSITLPVWRAIGTRAGGEVNTNIAE